MRYLPAPHGVTWCVPECVERQGHLEFNPNIFLGFVHGSWIATVWPAEWPAGAEAHAPSWPPSTRGPACIKMLTSRPRDLVTNLCTTDSVCKWAPRNKPSALLAHCAPVYIGQIVVFQVAQTGSDVMMMMDLYKIIALFVLFDVGSANKVVIGWQTVERRRVY